MGCSASSQPVVDQRMNGDAKPVNQTSPQPQQQVPPVAPPQHAPGQMQQVPPQQDLPPAPRQHAPAQVQPAPLQQSTPEPAPAQHPSSQQAPAPFVVQNPTEQQTVQPADNRDTYQSQANDTSDQPVSNVDKDKEVIPTQQKIDEDQDQSEKNDGEKEPVTVTDDSLKQFLEYEMEIRKIEDSKAEESLAISETQLGNLQMALKSAEQHLTQLRANTEKERRDVLEFNIANFMSQHQMVVMGTEEARQIEQEEYIEAQNKQDVAEKQVENLRNQINTISVDLEKQREKVNKLNDLKTKVDGLLENIFNGEYGSELEERLEIEAEQLLQYKQHISVAHYKWANSKTLINHACLQLAYAKRRWEQIQHVAAHHVQARYQMLAEVRSNLIAAHQNIQRTREYLNNNLAYFSLEDSQNLFGSINSIVLDILTMPSYHKALAWYKYYHYRSALLLNWMDQTINNKIVKDHQGVSERFRRKYAELRAERLRCIKERLKGSGLEEDLDTMVDENQNEAVTMDVDLTATESALAMTVEAPLISNTSEEETGENPPPPVDSQDDAMAIPEPPEQSESGPPTGEVIPLSALAPPPSSEELFGNIEELKEAHKSQLAEFEKAQTVNKTRMDQGLQEKLRARKSKRRRLQLHEDQTKALSKKYNNALVVEANMVATEEVALGGDGNPNALKSVEEANKVAVSEETVVPVEEVATGGDGNPDALQ